MEHSDIKPNVWLNVNFISIQLPPFSFITRFVQCGRRRTCAIKHNILLFFYKVQIILCIFMYKKRINTFHFYIYYYLYICYICISIEKKICAFYFGLDRMGVSLFTYVYSSPCSNILKERYK